MYTVFKKYSEINSWLSIYYTYLVAINNNNNMNNGTVKFFNETKGFGFITPEDGTADVFVHISGLRDQVKEGDSVTYDVERGPKGLNASNVRVN